MSKKNLLPGLIIFSKAGTAGFADNQFSVEEHTPGRLGAIFDQVDQQINGFDAKLQDWLPDGRKLDICLGTQGNVIESDQRNITGNG